MKVTQTEIARRVGMDVSSVNKILNRRVGSVFRKETVRKVLKVARELGYDFEKLKFHHRRQHPRKEVAIDAEVAVLMLDGSTYDEGTATIRDLSGSTRRTTRVSAWRSSAWTRPRSGRSSGLRPRGRRRVVKKL